jgi:D-sedoheptulose 7-phosphate isomerase
MQYAKQYIGALKDGLDNIDLKKIERIADVLYQAWRNDKQIFIFGNGGSATTASHFACDLGKGTLSNFYKPDQKRFRVMSLTDNIATMLAYGNDLSFDHIFSQQLKNLVREGDVVIGISASGNSKNVIKALKVANDASAITIGMLGFDGGKAKEMVDHHVLFEEKHYGRVEDFHLILEHLICTFLKEKIENEEKRKGL